MRQPVAALFVLYGVAAQLAAWSASLAGRLDSTTWVWGAGFAFIAVLWALVGPRRGDWTWSVWRRARRFRRILPAAFGITFLLVLLGAILHPSPADYDHLTYRFPRLLHWWAEGSWHRIPFADERLNYSGVGFEWMWYPLFLIFRSDIGSILLNVWGYALLPGLVFRTFVGLGVARRIAATWMWVLPAAHALVFQAAGAGNDLPGTVLALAACAFLLDARRKGSIRALGIGLLAAALCSGIKLSNAPLLLPFGIMALACAGWARRHALRMAPVVLACLAISFVPMAALNRVHTGAFTGDPENEHRMSLSHPVAGLMGNGLQTGFAALVPPINPMAGWWNERYPSLFPGSTYEWLIQQYPRFSLRTREIAGGEEGTIGLGVTAFLLFSLLSGRKGSRRRVADPLIRKWVPISIWAAFFLLMIRLGSEAFARVAIPFVPLLIAALPVTCRAAAWRSPRRAALAGALCIAITWPALILTPARPLWPWRPMLAHTRAESTAGRLRGVYEIYAQRPDAFAPLKAAVPGWSDMQRIGAFNLRDDPETSLWRPFDGRRVFHITPERLAQDGLELDVLIGRSAELDELLQEPEPWKDRQIETVRMDLVLKVQAGPEEWAAVWMPEQKD